MALAASAALTLFLGFSSGGFFPGAVGVAVALCVVALVLHLTLAKRPLAGLGVAVAVVAAALALLAAWTLASSGWSDAPARALIEFDRTVLYLLVFLLFALGGYSRSRMDAVAGGVLVGAAGICVAGFLSRTLPDSFPTAVNLADSRLSHPVDYWNALGMVGAFGILLALHFASAMDRPRIARALAAALTPMFCATVLLTFSRGAVGIAAVGLGVYVVLARSGGVVTGLLACAPPSAVATIAAYDAERLGTEAFRSSAAMAQGQDLVWTTAACSVAAALLLVALSLAERRLRGVTLVPKRARIPLAATAAVVVVAAALAAGAPSAAERQFDRFTESSVTSEGLERERLTQAANNGRLEFWRIAIDGFEDERLKGSGAGTYALLWARDRPTGNNAADGHSLALETAAELGLVGAALVACLVLVLLGVLIVRAGREGGGAAAAAAVAVMWTAHAAIDWGWEMPVVTAPALALGGVGVARAASGAGGGIGRMPRVVAALGCLVLAITPLAMARSQERLNESVRAFRAGDCAASIDAALASNSAVGARPEPFQMLSFCDLRLGRPRLAVAQARKAVNLDPGSWEFRYSLGLVQAAAGQDPSAALRQARRRNPRATLVRQAQSRLSGRDAQRRSRIARRLPLPFQQ